MTANIDAAMLEMFRSEAETHLAALNAGLLALEQQPQASELFEPMMRAAHSIKGAAKIVGLPAAVQVSHAIEDCFVAMRDGRARMNSALVDTLLASVDLLAQAADLDASGRVAVDPNDARIRQAVAAIESAMHGDTNALHAPIAKAPARLTGDWCVPWREGLASGATRLDLSEVTSLDAAALGFLALAVRAQTQVLENIPPALARLLRAVGLPAGPPTGAGA